jgi:hypothetical protein
MKTVKHFASNIVLAQLVAPLSFGQHYDQTTLVANTSGVASAIDPQLVNAWGLSRGSGSDWWISDAGTGVSTLYDGAGDKQSLVVTIPPADPNDTQALWGRRPVLSSMAAKWISCWLLADQLFFYSPRSMARLLVEPKRRRCARRYVALDPRRHRG